MEIFCQTIQQEFGRASRNVEDFVSLTRSYFQFKDSRQPGITNIRIVPDAANQTFIQKIPTQGGRLGQAEKRFPQDADAGLQVSARASLKKLTHL